MRKQKVVAIGGALAAVFFLASPIASAATMGTASTPSNGGGSHTVVPLPPIPLPSSSALSVSTPTNSSSSTSANTITTNAALSPNPWGCIGQANNPHLSTHGPDDLNGAATTTCTTAPPYLETAASLDWDVGLGLTWQLGADDYVANPGSRTATANASGNCPVSGNALYYTFGEHVAMASDGTEYTAETEAQATVNCP